MIPRTTTLFLLLAACTSQPEPAPAAEAVTRDAVLMGTRARLVTYAATRDEGLATLESILGILEGTDRELSTWQPDSQMSRLNQWPVGEPWPAEGRTCGLLGDLVTLAGMTGRAFDPLVGRLAEAWDIHGGGRVPDEAGIAAALEQSGMDHLAVDPDACAAMRQGEATIDVGGFGKGEALDRVVLAGIPGPWLVDLGGQVGVAAAPPDSVRWPIALAHPLDRGREALALEIPPGSLSTSAGSERDLLVDGERVGHILDPRTGRPAPFTGSVSVWHLSGLYADALSTALYVMGPEDGLPWAVQRGLAAVYLIPDDNGLRVEATPEFEPFIVGP